MTSINQFSDNKLENGLIADYQSYDQEESTEDQKITLKFSAAKPFVDLKKFEENDSSHMISESNGKPQLWFDDVSPTSSNNILSDDENGPFAEKTPENIFWTIYYTVIQKK